MPAATGRGRRCLPGLPRPSRPYAAAAAGTLSRRDKGLLDSLRTVFAGRRCGERPAAGPATLASPGSGSASLGLALCAVGRLAPRAPAGALLVGAARPSAWPALLASGFTIGASGWCFASLNAAFGELAAAASSASACGGALALLALLMLLRLRHRAARPLSRRPVRRRRRGAVRRRCCCCSSPCRWPRRWPAPSSTRPAGWSIAACRRAAGHERIWGLGCLAGGVRCGVAWNTLFLALLTAAGTTLLGTLMALMAERGDRRAAARRCNVLALLPIITPPFVVGLGPDPAVRPRRRRQPVARMRPSASRRRAGSTAWFGVWLAQTVRLHADRLHDHARRGAGHQPEPGGSGADAARRSRSRPSRTVTLPLLKPGLANAFLVGFIESMADFGNPVVVGGQFSVLSTEIFFAIVGAQFDQGRAASLAWLLTLFALAVFFAAARRARPAQLHHGVGQGRRRHADAAAGERAPRWCIGIALPWLAFTLVVYLFAFAGGFVQTWGRDYTPTLRPLPHRLRRCEWGAARQPGLGRHRVELVLHHPQAGGASRRRSPPALGLLIAWLLARTQFRGQRAVRVRRAAGLRDPRHRARRELHPGLQRAAVRADRHRR